jgi:hypothetical protein
MLFDAGPPIVFLVYFNKRTWRALLKQHKIQALMDDNYELLGQRTASEHREVRNRAPVCTSVHTNPGGRRLRLPTVLSPKSASLYRRCGSVPPGAPAAANQAKALLLPARIPSDIPARIDRIPWGCLLAAVTQ